MNSSTVTVDSKRDVPAAALEAEATTPDQLAEPWFAEPPPSSQRLSSRPPPVVHVGQFLGDPEVDAWLR